MKYNLAFKIEKMMLISINNITKMKYNQAYKIEKKMLILINNITRMKYNPVSKTWQMMTISRNITILIFKMIKTIFSNSLQMLNNKYRGSLVYNSNIKRKLRCSSMKKLK